MIIVIGRPIGRAVDEAIKAGGSVARVAMIAASAGPTVQLVGKIGDDVAANAVLLDLAANGIGHAALLRDPTWTTPVLPGPTSDLDALDPGQDAASQDRDTPPPIPLPELDPTDVELGLHYLTDFRVVVVAEPASAAVVAVAGEASRWDAARLIVVIDRGATVPTDLPSDALVLEAPDDDPDGAFADLVGTLAARLDGPEPPDEAFRASIAVDGWTDVLSDAALD